MTDTKVVPVIGVSVTGGPVIPDAQSAAAGGQGAVESHRSDTVAAVIARCLEEQAKAAPRTSLDRFFGATPLSAESAPRYREALGELHVAEQLGRLGPEWRVLAAAGPEREGSPLLIGPPGVYTLGIAHQAGARVWVDGTVLMAGGRRSDEVWAARRAAADAAKQLWATLGVPVAVRSVLVFPAPKSLTIKSEPDDVAIVSDTGIARRLQAQPPTLTLEAIEAISNAASKTSSWRGGASQRAATHPSTPGARRHEDPARRVPEAAAPQASHPDRAPEPAAAFEELRREIDHARTIRGLWVAVGLAAAAVVLFAAGHTL